MSAISKEISSQIVKYTNGPDFALPLEPFEDQETWTSAQSSVLRMRDALEYAGFGALTFALTRTVVNAYGGLEEGVDGGICATLHTIIVKEDDVLAAVVGKIHHAGVKIAIPEGSSGKRGFLQLVGALWADAKSTDRLTPWLTELLTPLVAVVMRAKAEYYESATFDHEAKRAHKKEIYIEQDIKFFNSLQDMFHQGRSAPAQNVTAVVPVPAKIDDGVSMKSLEEALDADDLNEPQTDDDDDATSTATATPTRPRSKAVCPSTAAATYSPLRAPLIARNLYLLEEEPLLSRDRAPSVISDSFLASLGPFEEGFTVCTEEEAYGLASKSAAAPGLAPAATISENVPAPSPPPPTKKRRISPNESQSPYGRASSISYQGTPPRLRW